MCNVYDSGRESFSFYFRDGKNTLTQKELKDIKLLSGNCKFEILENENRIVITPDNIELFEKAKYEIAQKYYKKLKVMW